MSGSNSICVATVLLETSIVTMRKPETRFKLERPGGTADPAVINATGGISASDGMGFDSINLVYGLKGGKGAGGPNQPCCFGKLRKNNCHRAEVHLLVDEHHVVDDWISDL